MYIAQFCKPLVTLRNTAISFQNKAGFTPQAQAALELWMSRDPFCLHYHAGRQGQPGPNMK